MFELFKRILNKHTDDPDILDIIEKEPEEWKEEWKAIHEKKKGLDSLTLNKFLAGCIIIEKVIIIVNIFNELPEIHIIITAIKI